MVLNKNLAMFPRDMSRVQYCLSLNASPPCPEDMLAHRVEEPLNSETLQLRSHALSLRATPSSQAPSSSSLRLLFISNIVSFLDHRMMSKSGGGH